MRIYFLENGICWLLILIINCTHQSAVAQSGPADTLIFAIITDTHIGKEGNTEGMRRIIESINQKPQIDFVVHTGDVSDFGLDSQLIIAKNLMNQLKVPYYIVPGNHETTWSGNGGLSFNKQFGNDKFVSDFKGYRLIGISTGPYIRHSGGYVTNGQLRWLDSIANVTPKDQPVLFFSHIPLIEDNLNNKELVIDRLKKFNVQASFCGHGHRNKIWDYEGLAGIMTTTAQIKNGTVAYNIITLTKDSVIVDMIRPDLHNDSIWAHLTVRNKWQEKTDEVSTPVVTGYADNKPAWTIADDGNIVSTPSIWKENFMVGNMDGEFKSYRLKDGKVNWAYKTRQAIYSSPAVSNGYVVFGSADSTIYCLNAQDGKLNWRFPVNGAAVASPLVNNDKVFIGSSDLFYRCIDLKTGRLIWKSKRLAGFPPGKPALQNDKLVFGTWNKTLYALSAKDGSVAWTWVNAEKSHYYSPAMCTPVIMKGHVYIIAPDEIFRVFDLKSGKEISEVKGHRVRESFGADADAGLIVAKTMKDSVVIWNVNGEKPRLSGSIFSGFGTDYSPSDVIIRNQMAFFGTTFGRLYAIDLQNKKVGWISQLSNGMINTPKVLTDHKILVTCADGTISLFDHIN